MPGGQVLGPPREWKARLKAVADEKVNRSTSAVAAARRRRQVAGLAASSRETPKHCKCFRVDVTAWKGLGHSRVGVRKGGAGWRRTGAPAVRTWLPYACDHNCTPKTTAKGGAAGVPGFPGGSAMCPLGRVHCPPVSSLLPIHNQAPGMPASIKWWNSTSEMPPKGSGFMCWAAMGCDSWTLQPSAPCTREACCQ